MVSGSEAFGSLEVILVPVVVFGVDVGVSVGANRLSRPCRQVIADAAEAPELILDAPNGGLREIHR